MIPRSGAILFLTSSLILSLYTVQISFIVMSFGSYGSFKILSCLLPVDAMIRPKHHQRQSYRLVTQIQRHRQHLSTLSTMKLFSTSKMASTAAAFQPPDPPGTKGVPIFPNIDLTLSSSMNDHACRRNSDPNAVIVVTGANRGIGLQFVKALLHYTKGTIVACCRSPATATELNELESSLPHDVQIDKPRIHIVPLDLQDQSSIEHAGTIIKEKYDRIDLLLNVAGILGDGQTTAGPERSITKLDRTWLERSMAINVIGPVLLTKELLPLLMQHPKRGRPKPGEVNLPDDVLVRPNAIVANLSARVGSITDNGLGGWYSYRMSKAALNQATRTMALELKRNLIWTVALHPGTTDTDLSKPFHKNVKDGSLFPVDFTVSQLLKLIDALQDENSGGFYDWSGKAISF